MKRIILIALCALWSLPAFADEPVQVNFNLVQVNNYPGQAALFDSVVTPGKRLVIDMNESSAILNYLSGTSAVPIRVRMDNKYHMEGGAGIGAALGWENSIVLYAPAKQDSFLVTSSRTGCPGTEVGPSVAVAFINGGKWSNPPIRFGPLTERTLCPLGKGYQLEVSGRGTHPPLVRVVSDRTLSTRR